GLVAQALVMLVPLIVVVKDEGDDLVEIGNETVRRDIIDEAVEAVVEIGKIVEAGVNVGKQLPVLLFQRIQLRPERIVFIKRRENRSRAQFEHFAYFKKFGRKLPGKSHEAPPGIGAALDEAKAAKPVEELAHAISRHPEL